ncbi:MAG: siphovirus Gp157 family protein [Planctomycetota bacterium]
MTRTLFDITADMRVLDQLLDECGGDVTDPKVEQAVNEWFDELDADLETKVDNYAALITTFLAMAKARKQEADRLALRVAVDTNAAASLKERLKIALQERGIPKLETRRYRVSVVKNGGRQPIDIHDAKAVPRGFCTHIPETWEPNAEAVRAALAAGREVPGAVLMERGTHLRIK